MAPGTKIALGIIRAGKPESLNLIVGQFSCNAEEASNDSQDIITSGKLGLAVSDLTAEARQQFQAPDRIHGVVVQNARPASPADEAGISQEMSSSRWTASRPAPQLNLLTKFIRTTTERTCLRC